MAEEDKKLATEFEQVTSEFKEFSTKMRDPLVVGALLNKLTEERQSTNLLLRELNAKLDKIAALESRIAELEKSNVVGKKMQVAERKVLLPEIDQEIITFMKKGAVCAEEVQEKFKYKGKNAASARLNKLCTLGVAKKYQVGKKVYFEIIESQ